MKNIIYFLFTLIAIFFIYIEYNDFQYNYVSVGDSLINNINSNNIKGSYNNYVKDYLIKNNKLKNFNNYFYNSSISGLTNDIKNNRTISINNKDYYLKKVLRESDIVVISIGMEGLTINYDKYDVNKNYRYFNKMYEEIEKLIMEIKKYAKGKILFLGYYNPTSYYSSDIDELFFNMDIKLNELFEPLDVIYIDLYEIVKGNQYKDENKPYLLNTYGNKKISDIIEYYLE